MFRWLTERRRRKLLEHPFPAAWERFIVENVALDAHLAPEQRLRLRQLTQIFVDEKRWEGCGGLELTDEIQVTIAAQACVLLLGRDASLYDGVEAILVYPTAMVAPPPRRSFFSARPEPVSDEGQPILGQAFQGGPTILAWDQVLRGGANTRDGRNVVYHEFAHQLDMLGGDIDGTPPLEDRAQRQRWAAACSEAFLALRADAERGKQHFLDAYGATNEAEFFAVATEAFFEKPVAFARELPALHDVLAEFYGLDPAALFATGSSSPRTSR